ncbi:transposase [[Clostridium] propionicum DSM 1682]|uniref:Integrase core domain protein n=2 Tax=Anaerotignum propionicum TaxID=28446 RepID=A0A0X1U930_ANAPI|nr:integrase core domain protein [Anaerotignum propionicum DSM 1682]SHE68243.1 transposase [[Clostridium] propionicum DSM 1682] [Anaerotignum propionicum DSM 1682]
MCKVLKICRSTYYKRLRWVPSLRELDCQKLDKEIQTIYYDSKKRYGAPKIQKVLISNGNRVSLKRVQRHMTVLGLRSIVVKKYRHYPSNQQVIERENILKQDFSSTGINQKWCTDITYIHTLKDGWTYLASVMDFYSKKIIGWAYGTSMTAELALRAVENACMNTSKPTGIILHSDLGTQYTSDLFEKYLLKHGIRHSFSRKGCPYDNACIESFHSLLKKEEVHQKTYIDSKDAFTAIFEYIESWYNRKRIHSSLNYQTPDAVYQAAIGMV